METSLDTNKNLNMDDNTENTQSVSDYFIPTRHPKVWIIIVIGLILVSLLVLFLINSSQNPVSNPSTKSYSDSLHYVSLNIPQDWDIDQEQGSNTTGLNTDHPVSQKIEISQLSNSSQEGITIQVQDGTPACPLAPHMNSMLVGFPASYDPNFGTWTIPTTKATVIVSVAYPGSNFARANPFATQVTPVPPAIAEKNRNEIIGILKTLKLNNLTPYSCK